MRKLTFAITALLAVATAFAVEFKIDFANELGPVKPVNGVGQPPMIGQLRDWSMFHYLKEAGIPFSRLHDVGGWFAGGLYVDVPNIFRDFDADENDPKNYTFSFTDSLLQGLEKNGVEPFFRLGVTIENFVYYFGDNRYPARHCYPPKDFAKWARICEHIIRHYTEGWAKGFRMKITYWEIWNEPDNDGRYWLSPLWQGSWDDFIRFYGVAGPYLKSKFPHLKIGAYGSCGFYAGVGSDNVPAANSSPRMESFVTCAKKFLAAVRDNKWPLDFFSYHSYSAPDEAMRQVRYADELLNSYGFTREKCERIYNEWLPYVHHDNLGSALQGAGVASELIELQNGPCDLACIYDARCGVGAYAPLFNPMTYKPHKAYYAFTAFNELRKCGTAVKVNVTNAAKGFHVTAAKGATGAAVMLANDSDKPIEVSGDFGAYRVVSARLTDATQTDATVEVPEELTATLPPHSFGVVLLSAK